MVQSGAPVRVGNSLDWRLVGGWLAVAVVACWFRLWQLGTQLVFDDEWHPLHTLIRTGYLGIFKSFGHADHSIPLTLLFQLAADTVGLNEWSFRLLPLAFGLLTVIAVPRLLCGWMDRYERLLLGGLLAVAPLLIYFSRQARPYAIVGLLVLAALVFLWRMTDRGQRRWGGAFVACAVPAAWLHPLSLAFTGPALIWIAGRELLHGRQTGFWRPLVLVAVTGAVTAAACVALLAWPVINDFESLAVKTGIHRIEPVTLLVAWQLFIGSGNWVVALVMAGLVVHGAVLLARRDPDFSAYLAFVAVAAAVLVWLPDAEWIHHGLVLARYLAVLQLLALALIALSLVGIGRWISDRYAPPAAMAACAAGILALLVWLGPLPEIHRGQNALTGHLYYQFDYDPRRNLVRRFLDTAVVPEVYGRIAAEPGDGAVIEAGWHFESHFNPLVRYQPVHGRPMKIGMITGLCAHSTWGELPLPRAGLNFSRFIHLSELAAAPGAGDFLVFHRESALPDVRELPDVAPCIEAFRDRLGEPWYDDGRVVVFDLRGPAQAGVATSAFGANRMASQSTM